MKFNTRDNQGKKWTQEEDNYLLSVYKLEEIKDIAIQLNRSNGAIISRYRHLEIKEILKQRNIKQLVHFSNYTNHESILKNGILSVNNMINRKINFASNDEHRYDKQLDCINLSISFINKPLLEKFKLNNPNTRWTIYRIDPNVIFQDYCYFYYTNAAFSDFKNVPKKHLSSPKALLEMFADKVTNSKGTWERVNLGANQTTCIQAEILIKDKISKNRILSWTIK